MSIAEYLSNYDDDKSVGSRFRSRRIQPFLELIEYYYDAQGHVQIVDIGGERNYWNIVPNAFLKEHNVHITIINLPGQNKQRDDETFTFVDGDACDLANVSDNQFDIAHSNSVIEHVGDWRHMKQYGNEIQRVAKSFFIQTPSYWFPIEPHFLRPFFHWLPKPLRVAWVRKSAIGHFDKAETIDEAVMAVESARLLDKKMFAALFPSADIICERFLFFTKSYIAVKR